MAGRERQALCKRGHALTDDNTYVTQNGKYLNRRG